MPFVRCTISRIKNYGKRNENIQTNYDGLYLQVAA